MVISKPQDINRFHMLILKSSLKLEINGMKRKGRSAYAIIKEEFNLKGNRENVLKQFEEILK